MKLHTKFLLAVIAALVLKLVVMGIFYHDAFSLAPHRAPPPGGPVMPGSAFHK